MLALSTARLPALYPLSLLAGLAFGAHWALMPSLASELFGLHHFAANYALLQVRRPGVGTLAGGACMHALRAGARRGLFTYSLHYTSLLCNCHGALPVFAPRQFAPAIGSFGLASRLAGSLYQRAIARHGGLGNECQGQDCFSLTFLVRGWGWLFGHVLRRGGWGGTVRRIPWSIRMSLGGQAGARGRWVVRTGDRVLLAPAGQGLAL